MKSGIGSRKRGEKTCYFFTSAFTDMPCFIVGSSPFINKINLNKIDNNLSISINRAMFKFKAFISMWQDLSFWKTDSEIIRKTECWKVCTSYSDPENCFYHFKTNGGEYKESDSCDLLYGSGSSGPLAFCFARAMGCSPIICIGMDCNITDNKTDFYGINKYWNSKTIPNCKNGLKWIQNNFSNKDFIMCDTVEKYENIIDKFSDSSNHNSLNEILLMRLKNKKRSR